MIDELYVKDIALIREARLNPAPGLTVITGETGAGKTALLSALKLVAGERADASMVREGASALQVQARVFPKDAGGTAEDDLSGDGVVVQRSVSSDGRSRVHVDGAIAQVGTLQRLVGSDIDLCGQHEHQRLLRPASHQDMLDAWAGADVRKLAAAYHEALDEATQAKEELDRIHDAQRLSSEQVDQARFVLRRIDEVAPLEGEYEELCAAVPKAENAETLMRGARGTCDALSGSDGALDALGSAVSLFEAASRVDGVLVDSVQALREATYLVEDVARDMSRYQDSFEFDAESIEAMQERIAMMQGLMRSWGPTMADVLGAREEAARTVEAVDGFEEQLAAATKRFDAAHARLREAGCALHEARAQAAPRFSREVTDQMARLELRDAGLECWVDMRDVAEWGPAGPSNVEFAFIPGKRLTARPLAKIASGGEMSRVMLAIKVVLGATDDVGTLVFDEVDAGVGGLAAHALADVVVDLARTHQVIVVTHLAQLAVPAQTHYIVQKEGGEDPQTTLRKIEGEDRVVEVARMLSGDATEVSLQHARQMLEDAGTL